MASPELAPVSVPAPGQAFQWRVARNLYPLYQSLGKSCELAAPCDPLHDGEARPEDVLRVMQWMYAVDNKLPPEEFSRRLALDRRTNPGAAVEGLLRHFVTKHDPTQADVDKADSLFLNYFYLYAPPSFHARRVAKPDVQAVLEPVTRYVPRVQAPGVPLIDSLITMVELATALDGAGIQNIAARTSELRHQIGGQYFARQTVVGFTHLNYTLRRAEQRWQARPPMFTPAVAPPKAIEPAPASGGFAFDISEEFCGQHFRT